MRLMKTAMIAILGLSVSGCAAVDVATRNATVAPSAQAIALGQVVGISDVKVNVSRNLKVSEAELYYPVADIVWRGDARGNRHEQVAAIFTAGAEAASSKLNGNTKARLEIDVKRFHALTNKARYTVGGVHSISFMMSLKDPETGVNLIEPRKIKADLKAYGGQDAADADARGETQKKRITEHLTSVIMTQIAGGIAIEAPAVSRNATALPKSAGVGSVY